VGGQNVVEKGDFMKLYEDDIGEVEFVDCMGDDLAIVNAARISFSNEKKLLDLSDRKLLRYMLKNGHWSPFDQAYVKFKIKVPLFVRSQHHRHCSQKFNEISRRYVAVDMEMYNNPEGLRRQHKVNKQGSYDEFFNPQLTNDSELYFENGCFSSYPDESVNLVQYLEQYHQLTLHIYNTLVSWGFAKEQVRGYLPQNLYTTYIATGSVRSFIHYLQQRLDTHAQWEHRKVAEVIERHLREHFPITFKILDELALEEG